MYLPQLLRPGSAQDPLVVVRSGFWRYNCFGLFDKDEALVVDPGIFPEDIALLGAAVRTRANTGPERHVRHVVLTHSHHDHIRGWASFPGAEVTMPRVAAEKSQDAQRRILAGKQAIDKRLELDDPNFAYPTADHTFDEPTTLVVGGLEAHLFPLYGHSNCCSVVWLPSVSTLCTADYLVSPGLPYCRWEARPFEEALAWLADFCQREKVLRVWPAHRRPLESPGKIAAALDRERGYMELMRTTLEQAVVDGANESESLERATRAVTEFRGSDSKASRLQDLDNAKRVLAEFGPPR